MLANSYRRLAAAYGEMGLGTKVALVAGLALVTTAIGVVIVVMLPADHFRPRPAMAPVQRHPVIHWTLLILKNAVGAAVLPLGIFMALPLVPGPGLVFILIGVSLLDFPGKRSLERKLLGRASVRRFLNELRSSFSRPPLILDEE